MCSSGEQEYANGVKGADFTVAVPRGTLVIDNRSAVDGLAHDDE